MARSKKIVSIDAFAAVKWFNLEDASEKALSLLDDYRNERISLVAPYLLIYEVASALRYNPDLGEVDVLEAFGLLGDL